MRPHPATPIKDRIASFHDMFVVDEHVGPGAVHQVGGHLVGYSFEVADGDDLVDQEHRLVIGKTVIDGWVFVVVSVDHCRFIQRHLAVFCNHRKNLEEVFLVRSVDLDLEEDAAQGGVVEDLVRGEAGREDHQRVERHLEVVAGQQSKDILVFFEWDEPAVDDALWAFFLSAKGLDDENVARRSQLER